MIEAFKSLKKSYIFTAIFYIILGIAMIAFRNSISRILCYVVGALLIIFGLIDLIRRISASSAVGFTDFGMINGLINIGIGIFFILRWDIVTDVVVFIVGMLIIVNSFLKFSKSIELCKLKYKLWWVVFLFALLTIGLGIWIIISNNAPIIMILCGISLILAGITDIIMIIFVSKAVTIAADEAIAHIDAIEVKVSEDKDDAAAPAEAVKEEAPAEAPAEPAPEEPKAE